MVVANRCGTKHGEHIKEFFAGISVVNPASVGFFDVHHEIKSIGEKVFPENFFDLIGRLWLRCNCVVHTIFFWCLISIENTETIIFSIKMLFYNELQIKFNSLR